jgi:hypothetical protein
MGNLSQSQIQGILCDVLPDECELAGDAHVASVAKAAANGEVITAQPPSRTGWRTSPEAALLAVAAAANFIRVCIDIYFTLKKAKGAKPTPDGVKEKAATQGASLGESAAKLAAAVCKALATV